MLYKSTGTKLLVIYRIEFSTKQSYCLLYLADKFLYLEVGKTIMTALLLWLLGAVVLG